MKLPQVTPRAEREAYIEKKTCEAAERLGYRQWKWSSPNRRNVPDRIFISPSGTVFFIEFKAKGNHPTAAQRRELVRLLEQYQFVAVVDMYDPDFFRERETLAVPATVLECVEHRLPKNVLLYRVGPL